MESVGEAIRQRPPISIRAGKGRGQGMNTQPIPLRPAKRAFAFNIAARIAAMFNGE